MSKLIKEGKAKAVHPEEGEVEQLIDEKLRERINRQKEYRTIYLNRRLKEEIIKGIKEEVNSGKITMKTLMGMTYTVPMLKIEHDLQLDSYRELVAREVGMKKALKNDGLTDEETNKVINGKYIKKDGK